MTPLEATLAELRDVSLLRLSLMAELERVHEARVVTVRPKRGAK